MLAKLKKWIFDVTTEPGNNIVCPVRIMGIFGFIYFLCTNAYTVYVQAAAFDMSAFGTSFGVIMATIGTALGLKSDTKADGA